MAVTLTTPYVPMTFPVQNPGMNIPKLRSALHNTCLLKYGDRLGKGSRNNTYSCTWSPTAGPTMAFPARVAALRYGRCKHVLLRRVHSLCGEHDVPGRRTGHHRFGCEKNVGGGFPPSDFPAPWRMLKSCSAPMATALAPMRPLSVGCCCCVGWG